jgi:MFS family permease
MTEEKPRRAHGLLLLCAAQLVVGVGNSMLLALLPPLAREIKLPDASVGAIFSLSALIWVFASPFWGRVSDTRGRKPIIALGLAAYAVSMAGFGTVAAMGLAGWLSTGVMFVGLMLTRSIFGLVGSATSPAAQAYIADHTLPERRTEELATLTSAFAVGQTIGPGLAAAITAELGYIAPIAMVVVLATIAAVVVYQRLPDPSPAPGAQPRTIRPAGGNLRLMMDARVRPFIIYGVGLSVVGGTLAQTYSFFTMDRLNVSGTHAAELSAAGYMVGALAMLVAQLGVLPRLRAPSRDLMVWGAVILGVGVLAQALATSLAALLISQFLQGLGGGLARPGFSGGASIAVRAEEQGAVAGLVVAANGTGFIIAPLTGGVLYDVVGPVAPLVVAALTLAAMATYAVMSRSLKAAHQPPPPEASDVL